MVDQDNNLMILRTTMRPMRLAGVGLRARTGRGPAVHAREVSPDGEVTFQWAPDAKQTAVTGAGQNTWG
jgi:hypothetical protein